MILPWVDYAKGSLLMKPEAVVQLLLGAFKMSGHFDYYELLALCAKDSDMLALDYGKAKSFASSANRNSFWPWEKENRDCDDQEAMFRADRIKTRWRAGLKSPEAFGGIDYMSASRRGQHWASWAIVVEGGILVAKIYQPDTEEWQQPDEVIESEYFDA